MSKLRPSQNENLTPQRVLRSHPPKASEGYSFLGDRKPLGCTSSELVVERERKMANG